MRTLTQAIHAITKYNRVESTCLPCTTVALVMKEELRLEALVGGDGEITMAQFVKAYVRADSSSVRMGSCGR